jgi:prepilin-type N-terminal cleavage/methylation domain-containing protein
MSNMLKLSGIKMNADLPTIRHKRRGFTLIELLVVISIIGVMSSIAIAAVSSARDKGTLAASQTFEHTANSMFVNDTVLSWEFDGDAGTTVKDASGNGNDLTINNASNLVTDTPVGGGKALNIPAGVTDSSVAVLKNPPTNDFSVSLWFKAPGSTSNSIVIISNASAFPRIGGVAKSNTWKLGVQNNPFELYFNFFRAGGLNYYYAGPYMLSSNKWYQLVGTCDSVSKKVALYVNGKQVGSNSTVVGTTDYGCSTGVDNSDKIYLASPADGSNSYLVDNVRIYRKALPIAAIQNIYLAESAEHPNLAAK